jgi:hypothetical protein
LLNKTSGFNIARSSATGSFREDLSDFRGTPVSGAGVGEAHDLKESRP